MVVDKADLREEKKVKKERAAKAEAKRKSKYEYRERKKKVAEMEQENNRYIYIFRTDNEKWWKIGWNSLLFYRYVVAKRIKREAHVNPDQDYGIKSPTGIISLRDETIGTLIESMKELKYKYLEKKSREHLVVMDLTYDVPEEDIKRYKNAEEAKLEYMNRLVPVVMSMPELESGLVEITKQMHTIFNRMPVQDRETYGNNMMELTLSSMRTYYYMTHDNLTPERALRMIKQDMLKFRAYLHTEMRVDLISRDAAVKLSTNVVEVERKIKSRLGEEVNSAGEIIRKNEARKKAEEKKEA